MTDKLTDAEIQELQAKKKAIYEELKEQTSAIMSLPAEQGITPDAWVIIEVKTPAGQFQKILAGWSGSYACGDSWRMSSPVKRLKVDIYEDHFTVDTESGSFYTLYKNRQGLRNSNAGIYNELKEKFGDMLEIVTL
jgi:hypothetical protein